MKASKISIKGVVQGVGFRPFVYRLAIKHQLNGYIQNTPDGVEVVVNTQNTQLFIDALKANLPPLASIQYIKQQPIKAPVLGEGFQIYQTKTGSSETRIPADVVICQGCLTELFDKESRYYLYPFISCTNCGPRYSTVVSLPYDRAATTFDDFTLCNDCKKAYQNPGDRRYHAQTTACKACGPQLSVLFCDIVKAVQQGQIVALKGNGGFRLIVDAKNKKAVQRLRDRKKRPHKPFALMALNVSSITSYAPVSDKEAELLQSVARPIVLLDACRDRLPDSLAPGLNQLGFMLPQSPVEYLLFYYLLGQPTGSQWFGDANDIVLVATSANFSGGSIIAKNDDAYTLLPQIADLIVTDNRQIAMKCDDSIVQSGKSSTSIIRRAKGYVPDIINLGEKLPGVLGTGGLLKNTFCFIKDNHAYLSQYLGDMDRQENIDYFHHAFNHFKKLFGVDFKAVACDLHPDFYTTAFAQSLDVPVYPIQHHKAHAASVMAEHHLDEKVLAVVLDGYGLGEDKSACGGELFVYKPEEYDFTLCGQLSPMQYFSGDKVQREPWRMALALARQFDLPIPDSIFEMPLAGQFNQLLQGVKTIPMTTSCGRLFDGVSSLLAVCHINTYEAQAAMQLQSKVKKIFTDKHLCAINKENQLEIGQLLKAVLNAKQQRGVAYASGLFHGSFAYALYRWIEQQSQKTGSDKVILSGGCFQNKYLLSTLCEYLQAAGFKVYLPKTLPFNDGGISLGQAWLAGKKIQQEQLCV